MGFFHTPGMNTMHFLLVLTLVQFWWIAIWGLAYIGIDAIAGTSKMTEVWIYFAMLLFTVIVIHLNPAMVDKL